MKYSYKDIKLPKWVSYRTYYPLKSKSRTYILNERLHTYIQLDDISSDFWYVLTLSENEYIAFLQEKKLEQDADNFLETLANQELIILNNKPTNGKRAAETFNTKDINQHVRFIEDMNKWLYKNGFMSSIFFELTYRCNLKCVHCYNPKNMSDLEIPFDKIKRIIDEAYALGCFTVTLSGGESTMYSHFIDLVNYIRDKHMSVEIFTNGQKCADDEKLYQELLDLYPHKIGVSLYSTEEQKHEKVTAVKGSYQKTIDVIKRLRKDGAYVQIKNFLLGFTCLDCIKVSSFGKEINANTVSDISLIPTIEGDKKTLQYELSEDDLFELFSNPASPLYIGENQDIFDVNKHKDESLCLGGFTGLCISPDLEVHICPSLPLPLGDLNKESLIEIWINAKLKDPHSKLYEWRKITLSDLKECYNHSYCRFCHYCAGMGYLENGFLKKSDVLCRQAKIKEKVFNRILKNNNSQYD